MINSADFTYTRGYLGLLSALGALIGTIACCTPSLPAYFRSSPAPNNAQVDETPRGRGGLAVVVRARVNPSLP